VAFYETVNQEIGKFIANPTEEYLLFEPTLTESERSHVKETAFINCLKSRVTEVDGQLTISVERKIDYLRVYLYLLWGGENDKYKIHNVT